jgi:hypothetical protein
MIPIDWEALDAEQKRQRARMDKRNLEDITRVLDNTDGLERLRNVSDEEWDAATEGENNAA